MMQVQAASAKQWAQIASGQRHFVQSRPLRRGIVAHVSVRLMSTFAAAVA